MRSPRRSLIGSYRYSVVIIPDKPEFSDSMSGNVDLYDGKHVVESHGFTSFDQLATIIMNYWEAKLGTEVNIHRFSNWLSEYLSDIGITNINFYQMLESVKSLGKGISLHSSGVAVREAKVIHDYLGDKEIEPKKEIALKPAGSFVDIRGEVAEHVPSKLRPEEPPTDTVLKPSEIFQKEETVSPVVTHIPIQKEEEKEKPAPPVNTLLKPSEVLKQRDTVVFVEDEPISHLQVSGDPVITSPQEKIVKSAPPTESLLKPSEYLKQRDIIDVIFDPSDRPRSIPEEKKTESVVKKPVEQQKLTSPSSTLMRPSEYLREMEIEAKEEEPLTTETALVEEEIKESVSPSRIDPEIQKIPAPPISEKLIEKEVTLSTKAEEAVKEIIDFGIEVKEESEPIEVTFREIKTIDDLRVTDIMGVGEKTALMLENGGFNQIQKIMEATPEELSKIPGIGITSAKQLIYGAKALMKKGLEILAARKKAAGGGYEVTDIIGVGNKTAMLLKEGGFESVGKIVESTPEILSKIPGIGLGIAKKLIQSAQNLLNQEETN